MRPALLAVLALACSLAGAAPAVADGASMSLGISPGPTVGEPVTFTIQGMTPGPDQDGLSEYGITMDFQPARVRCASNSAGMPDNPPGEAFWGHEAGNDISPQFLSGSFDVSYTYAPAFAAEQEAFPGRYRECAWLEDVPMMTDSTPAVLAAQRAFSIRAPHDTIAIHGPRRMTIGHLKTAGDRRRLPYATVAVSVAAQVTRDRAVELVAEPRGVRRCPRDVWSLWDSPRFLTPLGSPMAFASPRHSAPRTTDGFALRSGGRFTYRFRAALVAEGGARPGRTLVCAGVYDETDAQDDPDNQEAAAHTWVMAHG